MYLKPKVKEIVRRREEAALSQHQLSRKAKLGSSAIYRIEAEVSKSTHHLRAKEIADALHCKVEDIFEEVIR
ncbi:MAG: helix-turn-helix transcriptional regulator [Ruminococcaceae bacterium]|nr:helix-turn-helix transcriptional regulator [Oscillospiraceae bacterium]